MVDQPKPVSAARPPASESPPGTASRALEALAAEADALYARMQNTETAAAGTRALSSASAEDLCRAAVAYAKRLTSASTQVGESESS